MRRIEKSLKTTALHHVNNPRPGYDQNNKSAAFYTRTFDNSKKRLYSFRKDVLVIVNTVRKWKYLLTGSHVTIKTDQRSASFIFNVKHSTKIKHEKLARWRLELSVFNYDVIQGVSKVSIHFKI